MQNVNNMHEEDLFFMSSVVSNFEYSMCCEFIDFPLDLSFLTQRILKVLLPLCYLSRLMQSSLYLRVYIRRCCSADLKIVKFYEVTT